MEMTFHELRSKEVINLLDGRRLGRICDLVFDMDSCCVIGFVVPLERHILRPRDDVFIPWREIQKIGDDVIFVRLCEPTVPREPSRPRRYRQIFRGPELPPEERPS